MHNHTFFDNVTGTNSRPSTPGPSSAKTPGEIVTSALRSRSRPTGGLRKAIGMYQESRRQSLQMRKTLQENRHQNSFMEDLEETEESDKNVLLQPEKANERVSSSAGQLNLTFL